MHVGVAMFNVIVSRRVLQRPPIRSSGNPRRASGLESEGEYNPHPPPPNLRGRVL
jgi:hypothetical protein